jgi:hypothetical protein
MGLARTLEKGHTQVFLAPQVVGVQMRLAGGDPYATFVMPQFELGLRHGVADGLELGGKLWALGAQLEGKVQLARGAVDLALGPGVSYVGFRSDGDRFRVVTAGLPLLVGFNAADGSQFVLAPKLVYQTYQAPATDTFRFLFLGSSLGYAWRAGERIHVLPELTVLYPVANSGRLADVRFDGAVFQAGIGFLFGG